MILSPVAGFVIAFVLAMIILYFLKGSMPLFINQVFGKLQIVSSAFFSLAHGANAGQKTMGVITALLIAGGFMSPDEFVVPTWAIMCCCSNISWNIFGGMANSKNHGVPYYRAQTLSRFLR